MHFFLILAAIIKCNYFIHCFHPGSFTRTTEEEFSSEVWLRQVPGDDRTHTKGHFDTVAREKCQKVMKSPKKF